MTYDFSKLTILVVEDNQPMLEVTKSLLGAIRRRADPGRA